MFTLHFDSSRKKVIMTRVIMIAIALALLVATVSSGPVPAASSVAIVDHRPRYAYDYAVNDLLTKDNKAQWEARDGDVVKGSYSLVEPDGSLRVVDYKADDATGFNAVVKRLGPSIHPSPLGHKIVANIPLTPPIPIAHKPLPIISPLTYGIAPLAIGLPKATSVGHWSLPWDPLTHSYGGWVPLHGSLWPQGPGPYATIYSKKKVNGKVVRWATGPISLAGRKLILRKKH